MWIIFLRNAFVDPEKVLVKGEGDSTHEVVLCSNDDIPLSIQTTIPEEIKNIIELNENDKIVEAPGRDRITGQHVKKSLVFTVHAKNAKIKNLNECSVNLRILSVTLYGNPDPLFYVPGARPGPGWKPRRRGRKPLSVEPPVASVPAAGGTSTHTLTNSQVGKMVFKIKSSNNNEYRVNPVFGFVDGGATTRVEITRLVGPPKEDKFVVQFAPVFEATTDAQEAFKGATSPWEITIPCKAE